MSESFYTVLEDNAKHAVEVTVQGGSGKATVTSPCEIIMQDGQVFATLEWSSSYYDYMKVDGKKYLPVNREGNSTFEIPVDVFDEPIMMIADTTAMSTAHEVEYEVCFYSDTIMDIKDTPQSRAKYSLYVAFAIIAVCACVSLVKKHRKKVRSKSTSRR